MQHISDDEVQAFIDGQLNRTAQERVEQHLKACPPCCRRVDGCRCVCADIERLRPGEEMFRSDGEFWIGLVGRLPARRPPVWPWVSVLPPLLLGALGTTIQVLITAVLFFYALSGSGLLPSPAATASSWLSGMFDAPLLRALAGWIGSSEGAIADQVVQLWSGVHPAVQHLVIFAALLFLLGASLAAIVALSLSWAMVCGRGTPGRGRESYKRG